MLHLCFSVMTYGLWIPVSILRVCQRLVPFSFRVRLKLPLTRAYPGAVGCRSGAVLRRPCRSTRRRRRMVGGYAPPFSLPPVRARCSVIAADSPEFDRGRPTMSSSGAGLINRPVRGRRWCSKGGGQGFSAPSIRGDMLVMSSTPWAVRRSSRRAIAPGLALWKHGYKSKFRRSPWLDGPRCARCAPRSLLHPGRRGRAAVPGRRDRARKSGDRETQADLAVRRRCFGVGSSPVLK